MEYVIMTFYENAEGAISDHGYYVKDTEKDILITSSCEYDRSAKIYKRYSSAEKKLKEIQERCRKVGMHSKEELNNIRDVIVPRKYAVNYDNMHSRLCRIDTDRKASINEYGLYEGGYARDTGLPVFRDVEEIKCCTFYKTKEECEKMRLPVVEDEKPVAFLLVPDKGYKGLYFRREL